MNTSTPTAPPSPPRLRDMTATQWKSGAAAWLGWLFDGLDMHLYTLVATPFVALLLQVSDQRDPAVGYYGSLIQAAFLIGWALGGGFFGVVGDWLGRSRTLCLTILTYAVFTGLSFFATSWWELMLYRFLAALGIGGEWAVGASLLSETWPSRWRPWMAAVLQTAVNIGVLLAAAAAWLLAGLPHRYVFLVGILPALFVLWIRKEVPETEAWQAEAATRPRGRLIDLFGPGLARTTWLVIGVCALSLTAHWAFMYWVNQHIRVLAGREGWEAAATDRLVSVTLALIMVASIAGNFGAAALARSIGYRRSIACLCLGYALTMGGSNLVDLTVAAMLPAIFAVGFFQGVFALFTMYLPPLFPTHLRTTGAGFCYNIGRLAAAAGTIYFGTYQAASTGQDFRLSLFYASLLFWPAMVLAWQLPEPPDEMNQTG